MVLSKKFAVKPALLGGLCLLGAFLLAWISPKEGVAGLLGMGSRDGLATEGVRTKVRDREDAVGREVRSVAEEYMMKAERGMTEDEVRWVVEDFLALGLDVEYPEDTTAEGYLALRKAREDWYLGALVSGLRLTKEQERQAREAMGVLREKDYAEFVEYLNGVKSFEDEGQEMKVFDGGKARKLMSASYWLFGPEYLPAALCELSEEQKAVSRSGFNGDVDPFLEDGVSLSDEHVAYDMYAPFFYHVFPLTDDQDLESNRATKETEGWLPEAMCLHPNQLKIILLSAPESIEKLKKELEQLSEELEKPGE